MFTSKSLTIFNFNKHSVDKLYFWEQNVNMFFQKKRITKNCN